MTSRRSFLQTTALAAAAPLAGRASFALEAEPDPYAAVVDERYAVARRFGARASFDGLPMRAIGGDITALWFNELDLLWRRQPTAIAGLTERPALFCLEQLGWPHRMRVVYHAEHRSLGSGDTLHRVTMPALGLAAADLMAAGAGWPEFLASALVDLPLHGAVGRGPSQACMAAAGGGDEISLHSWMLAPVRATLRGRGA